MRMFIAVLLTNYDYGDEVSEDEVGGECDTHGGYEKVKAKVPLCFN
jgi:hypothetical protein